MPFIVLLRSKCGVSLCEQALLRENQNINYFFKEQLAEFLIHVDPRFPQPDKQLQRDIDFIEIHLTLLLNHLLNRIEDIVRENELHDRRKRLTRRTPHNPNQCVQHAFEDHLLFLHGNLHVQLDSTADHTQKRSQVIRDYLPLLLLARTRIQYRIALLITRRLQCYPATCASPFLVLHVFLLLRILTQFTITFMIRSRLQLLGTLFHLLLLRRLKNEILWIDVRNSQHKLLEIALTRFPLVHLMLINHAEYLRVYLLNQSVRKNIVRSFHVHLEQTTPNESLHVKRETT